MDTFDDFLRDQLSRVKLDEYDLVARAKLASDRDTATKLGKFSSRQQGKANLLTLVEKLVKGFKVYCGEQEIPIRDAKLEDFISHVRSAYVQGDSNFDQLAYGVNAGKSAHKDEIDSLANKLNAAFQGNESVSAEMLQPLEDFAATDKPSEMAVRKVMWQLARKYPSKARLLNLVKDKAGGSLIGLSLDSQKLYQAATGLAKVLLANKASEKDAGGAETNKKEGEAQVDPKDLNDGVVDGPIRADVAKGYTSEAFADLVKSMKLSREKFKRLGTDVGESIKQSDDGVQKALCKDFDRRYTRADCIRFTRKMLEFYYDASSDAAIQPLLDLADDATKPRLESAFNQSLRLIRKGVGKQYDATKVNELLAAVITREYTAAKLLVLMSYCTHRLFEGAE